MRSPFVTVLVLTAVACSPAQRTVVGGGMAGLGLIVASAAVESMAEPCREYQEPEHTCSNPRRVSAGQGIAVGLAGLGVAVVGGAILLSARDTSSPTFSSDTAPPPETPPALAQTDAVGMAVAQLVLVGLDGNRKPGKLLDVDDTRSELVVVGAHAELTNLRVHVASDGSWLTLGACFDYAHEWQVTSLGTSPNCR